MSAVSTTGEKTFLQKWKILNSIFAMARIAVCCPANDLGKSRRILLPQQLRDFAWLPDSASWASAKKKLTINYLSGTRGNDIELPADELRNARALGLSASISLSIQLPGRDFKTLLPATKLRILPEIHAQRYAE